MSEQMPPDEVPPSPDNPVTVSPPAAPPARRRWAIVAAIVAALLVVGGTAGALSYFKLRGAPGAVLDKVPVGADVVVVAHLDPAASQKANLFRMTEKFPDLGTREALTERFNDLVDQAFRDAGLSHDDLGWIGGEAGGYVDIGVGAPAYAFIMAVDDEGAANTALQALRDHATSSSGVTYTSTSISGVEVWVPSSSDEPATAVFDGVAVLASDENTMRSVIDTANGASSVEDGEVFQGVMDRLPESNLGFAFVNVGEVVSLLDALPVELFPNMPSSSQFAGIEGLGLSVTAQPDGLALDSVVTNDPAALTRAERDALNAPDEPTPLLRLVPAETYGFLALNTPPVKGGFDRSLGQLSQLDPSAGRVIQRLHLSSLLPHLTGDVAIQVGPGTGFLPVGGTTMIGIDNRKAVSAWLDRYLPTLLRQADLAPGGDLPLTSTDHRGVTITSVAIPVAAPVSWAVVDDALIVGISPVSVEAAIDLSQGGSDSILADPGYQSAAAGVPGKDTAMYIDVQSVLSAVQGFLPAEEYQGFLDDGGDNLAPIEAIVVGATTDEDASTARLLIKVP